MEQNIGQNIVKYRKAAGLSQQKLGDMICVSAQAISRWENGSMPDAASLPRLAQALGCTLDDLYGISTKPAIDVREILTQELTRVDGDKRHALGISLAWHIMKVIVSREHKQDSLDKSFEMLSSCEDVDPKSTDIPVVLCNGVTKNMIAQASTAPDGKYVLMMSEPSDGFASLLQDSSAFKTLFALLCRPNRLEILMLALTLPPKKPFTREFVCEDLGIEAEAATEALEDLFHHMLLQRQDIQSVSGDIYTYNILADPSLLFLLFFASLIMRNENIYIMHSSSRKAPLIRRDSVGNTACRRWPCGDAQSGPRIPSIDLLRDERP